MVSDICFIDVLQTSAGMSLSSPASWSTPMAVDVDESLTSVASDSAGGELTLSGDGRVPVAEGNGDGGEFFCWFFSSYSLVQTVFIQT
jgi:hypothetical protein